MCVYIYIPYLDGTGYSHPHELQSAVSVSRRFLQELSEWEQLLRSKSWQTGEAAESDVEPPDGSEGRRDSLVGCVSA